GEDLVGLLCLLELLFAVLAVGIAVRMVLHRELAVRLLDLLVGGVPVQAEHFVVIALFGHRFRFMDMLGELSGDAVVRSNDRPDARNPPYADFLSFTSVYSASTTLPSSLAGASPPALAACGSAAPCAFFA